MTWCIANLRLWALQAHCAHTFPLADPKGAYTMIWRKMLSMVLAMWCAPAAVAQPAVFFDDFDGNDLQPHWGVPPAWHWEYNVSNSMLNVTGLFYPSQSHPPLSANYAYITAPFAPQSDFRMDVWMGWEAGQMPHRLTAIVGGAGGSPYLARFGFRNEFPGTDPSIYAAVGGGGGPVSMPAPSPGIYQFTISRTGSLFNCYFNGVTFATFQDSSGISAASIVFEFVGPHPGTLGVLHVDRVLVVPAPASFLGVLALLFLRAHRARR
jgi:hypothetical protein